MQNTHFLFLKKTQFHDFLKRKSLKNETITEEDEGEQFLTPIKKR
jgi:hypothetical protein